MKRLSWGLAVVFSLLTALTLARAQHALMFREQGGLTVSARVDEGGLNLRVLDGGALYSGIVHTYLVRRDFAYLYFEYPDEGDRGQYRLDWPAMEAGVYDLVVEITGGGGHEHDKPRFVQVFPLGIEGKTQANQLSDQRRLELKRGRTNLKPAGQRSSFELTTLLDGKPAPWNPYYVHQFVLKTDWSYFKHDHPKDVRELGVGSVQSGFSFPGAGEYVVYQFLESGVQVGGNRLRPVLRFPDRFNIAAN